MSAELFGICERLLSATVNGLYQGLLVALLAGLALRFCRSNAATRHAVWFGVLVFVAALIPAHLVLSWPRPPRTAETAPSLMAASPAPTASVDANIPPLADSASANPPLDKPDAGDTTAPSYLPPAEPQPERSATETATDSARIGPRNLFRLNVHQSTVSDLDQRGRTLHLPLSDTTRAANQNPWFAFARNMLKPFAGNFQTSINLPHSISLGLISAWLLLAGIRAGMIFGQLVQMRRIKRTSQAPGPGLQTTFDRLRDSLAIRRGVQLRVSSAHRTALVLGFIHPVILLPAELDQGSDDELRQVLRHEIAHVDRWDDWGNLLQQLIQAALFFHPAVWWVSRRLSLEREIACDDRVLEAIGQPRAYALTLANVASRMHHRRQLLAPGVSNNNSQLQQRINMILNTRRDRSSRLAGGWLGFFTSATALLAALAIAAGPRLVLAQTPTVEAAPSASTAPAEPPTPPVPPTTAAEAVPALIAVAPTAAPGVETAPALISATPSSAQVAVSVAPHALVHVEPAVTLSADNLAPVALTPAPLVARAGTSAAPGAWTDVESGPRPKTTASEDEPGSSSFTPAPRAPSLQPVAPVQPIAPVPAAVPGRTAKRHLSVEERLDRIERMLEDMEARGNPKGNYRLYQGYSALPNSGQNQNADLQPNPRSGSAYYPKLAVEQGLLAADVARKGAEAGQRAADQAMRDIARLKDRDFQRLQEDLRAAESENSIKALEALREARVTLQDQMKNLEREIKRLEEQQSQLRKNLNRLDKSADEPKEDGGLQRK